MDDRSLMITIFIFSILNFPMHISAQSGGTFSITQSVVAGGGGQNSTGGAFNISGTGGQSVAGTTSSGTTFNARGGFWHSEFGPSAAGVSVSGRVMTSDGRGIRNVRVTLVDTNSVSRTTVTSSFGYYRFDDVEAGQTSVVSVAAKRYTFATPTRIVPVQDQVTDIDFTAEP